MPTTYAAVVKSIQKQHGVKVAPKAKRVDNPYRMSAGDARSIAIKAGIITKNGDLNPSYR